LSRPAAAARFIAGLIAACLLQGCARQAAGLPAGPESQADAASAGIVNVCNWTDYIDPSVIVDFERETGIKVNYDTIDSNVVLETKLLAGNTGYDVVVPTGFFLQRQIGVGVYRKLDRSQLPNFRNLDPDLLQRLQANDPGNQYAAIYFWGTQGLGYNPVKIAAAMPDAPLDSFAMLYDPAVVSRFKDCGVSILDAPDEVLETVLLYLGRDPNSESLDDLRAAEKVLMSVRPYLRYIHSSRYLADLASGELCLAMLWSGDYALAGARAREMHSGVTIRYILPREGSMIFIDALAIPADAPHPRNAHRFIDFLMRADVSAKNAAAVHYATSNAAAMALIPPEQAADHALYPGPQERARLHAPTPHSLHFSRALTRMWTRFKTGQ
jgi:putrescine transport system substrate-binding protein